MEEFSGIRATARPKRDEIRRLAGRLGVAVLLLASGANTGRAGDAGVPADPATPGFATAAPRARSHWLVDPLTGRALGGYDPVAYFLNGRPTLGDPDRQFDWGGVTWLFQDQGTEAAFRDAPETYAPLFAGRCAFAVSQGRPAEGSPQHFLVFRGRLLLFADATARAAFLLAPDRLLAEAERRWPALLADLP